MVFSMIYAVVRRMFCHAPFVTPFHTSAMLATSATLEPHQACGSSWLLLNHGVSIYRHHVHDAITVFRSEVAMPTKIPLVGARSVSACHHAQPAHASPFVCTAHEPHVCTCLVINTVYSSSFIAHPSLRQPEGHQCEADCRVTCRRPRGRCNAEVPLQLPCTCCLMHHQRSPHRVQVHISRHNPESRGGRPVCTTRHTRLDPPQRIPHHALPLLTGKRMA